MFTRDDTIESTQEALRLLSEPAGGLTVKAQQNAAARESGLPVCRIVKFWYGIAEPKAHEYQQIMFRAAQRRARHDELRERQARLAERVAALRADVAGAAVQPTGAARD